MIAGLLLITSTILGQTTPSHPAFDVATVKPSAPLDMAKLAAEVQAGKMPRLGARIDASRASYTYMSLKELIAAAYKLKGYQISGPAWLASERFDIVGTIPDGASKDDVPAMLQALLEDRFKLAAHRDVSEHRVLALVVGKNGPKLKESSTSPEPIDENAPLKPGELKMDGPDGQIRIKRNSDGSTTANMGAKGIVTQRLDMETKTMHLESSMVTMAGFADMLTKLLQMGGGEGRQVVDMTGLKGNYQVAVEISLASIMAMAREQGLGSPMASPNSGAAAANSSPEAEASDPGAEGQSIFDSVQKLGLKLEPSSAKVEQLIVDHVEKTPTEN